MVEQVLRGAGVRARVRLVRASEGERARAEPVAALYEQGRGGSAVDRLRREESARGAPLLAQACGLPGVQARDAGREFAPARSP